MVTRSFAIRAFLILVLALPCTHLYAAALQVSPVSVEVTAPGATATLSLHNESDKTLNAQVRVFRWTQVDGVDKLVPTQDVVASPPLVSLKGNAKYSIRIVRVSKQPVVGEESYRLMIDELPAPVTGAATINIVLRYSIPVFFIAAGATAPKVSWRLQSKNGRPYIVATNEGDRHIRLAKLKVQDVRGAAAYFGDGLAGYVLGRSSFSLAVPASAKGFGGGVSASISALTNNGPFEGKP